MAQSTYSFLDVTGAIHCDKVGDYIFTGKGVGSITIPWHRNEPPMMWQRMAP